MQKALKNVPVEDRPAPGGLVQYGDEFYYMENPPGTGVQSLDVGAAPPAAEQKARDAVRNELF
jgi:penicillin-binding protein 1A